MSITVADMAAVLPTLDSRQVAIAASVLQIADPPTPGERLRLGLYEWLLHLGFVTDAQARAISVAIHPAIDQMFWIWGKRARVIPGCPPPTCILTIADRQWAGWTGRDIWYDFVFEKDAVELPEPAVTQITCNLTALHLRLERWLTARKAHNA